MVTQLLYSDTQRYLPFSNFAQTFSHQVVLLILCACMVSEKVATFVKCATTCDIRVQHEIREMCEWVLTNDNRLMTLESSFHQVLSKKLGKYFLVENTLYVNK